MNVAAVSFTRSTHAEERTMATPHARMYRRSHESELDNATALGLIRHFMDELTTLFRQEVALVTAEVTGAIGKLTAGILSIVTGGAVLFAGFLVLLAAAVLGLANVVAPWLAALIVGVVVSATGLIMVLVGRKAADPSALKPERSVESLRKDKAVLTRSAT
jgi:Putative Actinobacterial Holin-X, holin superfamily III